MPSLKDRFEAFIRPPKVKAVEKDGILQLYVKASDDAPWRPSAVGFGPGEPLRPMAAGEDIRREDFAVGRNVLMTPRAAEPRAITYSQMRELSRLSPVLRTVIEKRKDEMKGLGWSIGVKDGGGKRKYETAIEQVTKFFMRPDADSRFDDWLGMILEDVFVLDAATIYKNKSRAGELLSLDIIDGSTILLLVDDKGRLPAPPEPAYEQVIKGFPRTWWTKEELLYFPYNRASDGVYGFSHVESIIMYVNIALRRDTSFLEWFRAGNMPPALFSVPDTWTPGQIDQFQTLFDARLAGNLAERSKMMAVPTGQVTELHPLTFDAVFDEWLARIICARFGVNPNAYVKMMNRATSESVEEASTEESLVPMMNHLKAQFDEIIAVDLHKPYLQFLWAENQAHYSKEQSDIDINFLTHGVMTINQVLEQRGLEALDNDLGNTPLIWSSGGAPVTLDSVVNPPEPKPVTQNVTQPADDAQAPALEDLFPGAEGKPKPPEQAAKDFDRWERFALKRLGKEARPFETVLDPFTVDFVNKGLAVASTSAEVKAVFDAAKSLKKKFKPLDHAETEHHVASLKARMVGYFRQLEGNVVSRMASKAISPSLMDPFDDAVNWLDAKLLSLLTDELAGTYRDGSAHMAMAMGRAGISTMGITPPAKAAAAWAQANAAARIAGIDETTRKRIADIINKGLQDNLSPREIAQNLRAELKGWTDPEKVNSRAATIARTETAHANREAGRDTAAEVGAEGQEWIAQPDCCDDCQENADMGVISIDDDFPNDDHPNCRCDIEPVWRMD